MATTAEFMRKMRAQYKAQWRKQKKRKKKSRRSTPSSTAGHTKGDNCKATTWDRFCSKYSRATRYTDEYANYCKRKQGVK